MRVKWATVVLRRSVLISADTSDLQLAVEKEKVEQTCSAVIVAFGLVKISAGQRCACLQEVEVHLKKTSRRGLRQEDRKLLYQLGKSTFAATSGIGRRSWMRRLAAMNERKGPKPAAQPF